MPAHRYHVNPETNRPGQCVASKRGCKYAVDGQEPQHYGSKEEARQAIAKQAALDNPDHLQGMGKRKSNRSENELKFKGGIQEGTSATSEESKWLDQMVRRVAQSDEVQNMAKEKGLLYVSRLSVERFAKLCNQEGNEDVLRGMQPDGGVFLNRDGVPVLTGEAKKQGEIGNAVERIAKNIYLTTKINPKMTNLAFAYGDGFFNGNVAEKTMGAIFAVENMERAIPSDRWWNNHLGANMRMYRFEADADRNTAEKMVKEAFIQALNDLDDE